MRRITIQYHHEREGWWAESPDLAGFSAAAGNFNELRRRTFVALDEVIEEPFLIVEDNKVHRFPQEFPDTSNITPIVAHMGEAVPA